MSEYFYCDLCDKSIKIKSKKNHFNSQYHKSLTKSIICKYTVKKPSFLHIEVILKNFVNDYNKKIEFYIIFCKWKLHFSDTIINVKSDRSFNINHAGWDLRRIVISKIEYFESNGHQFSHISEMNIVLIADLRNVTYEHYLNQPKSMLECKLNALLAKNPKLIKISGNSSHPIIRNYQQINEDDEDKYDLI